MKGPEERYEDQCIWNEEEFIEERERLSDDEMNGLKADEEYTDYKESK